jgi:hypothetical protein
MFARRLAGRASASTPETGLYRLRRLTATIFSPINPGDPAALLPEPAFYPGIEAMQQATHVSGGAKIGHFGAGCPRLDHGWA